MASEVDVYNQALMNIGVFNAIISDPMEQSKEADVCRTFYSTVRKYVLRDHPWNFAETRTTLASLGTPPQNWGYNYSLPSDFIRALYVTLPGVRRPRYDQQPVFKIISSGTLGVSGAATGVGGGTTPLPQTPGGPLRQLVSDTNPLELVYTADVADLNQWDPIALSALAYRLGAQIAMPMKANPSFAQNCMQAYYREVSVAAAAAANEEVLDPEPLGTIMAARQSGTGLYDGGMFPDGYVSYPTGNI